MVQRRTKTAGKSIRTVEQYCSVCKKTFQMPVVEEADGNEVLWLRCPDCRGYLPCMASSEEVDHESGNAEVEKDNNFQDLALEDIDTEGAREYRESYLYEVGEIIYHRSWNDYGKVISKGILPGHRQTILVNFINQGKIRLLEGVA